MRKIKLLALVLVVITALYLAFYKEEAITIEGRWKAKTIVLDGKTVYPTEIHHYIDFPSEVLINKWVDSLSFENDTTSFSAHYEVVPNNNNGYEVVLHSKEKALNGTFVMELDTTHLGSLAYDVYMKLRHKTTLLHLKKEVRLRPWKPEFPRKGQV